MIDITDISNIGGDHELGTTPKGNIKKVKGYAYNIPVPNSFHLFGLYLDRIL